MTSTTLYNAHQGHSALMEVWHWAKPMLLAGHRLSLTVGEEKRNGEQNKKLHATIAEIAKQKEWAGKRWDEEVWKRLLIAAWCRTKNEAPIILPALDGAGIDAVYRRSSQLTKAECSELLEFVIAWAAQNGVECAVS